MQRLFIGNLPYSAVEGELKDMLGKYTVGEVIMPKDRDTGKFRGFAFADVEDADAAIRELDGGDFGGRSIKVSIAQPRAPRG